MIKIKQLTIAIAAALATIGVFSTSVYAAPAKEASMAVSPMQNKIVLTPGETYSSSIKVFNSSNDGSSLSYKVFADSFFVDDDYNISLGTSNDFNAMKNWITIDDNADGTIPAGAYVEVHYTITVPKDAPAGGQYASIVAQSTPADKGSSGVSVQEIWQIASTIYASISGESTFAGTIVSNSVPSIVFTAPLVASTAVENTGNVHGDVVSYLQVFPLFSDEEVYTNEEDPTTSNLMPGTTRYITNSWDGAPALGIFRVIQTVEAFGGTSVSEKVVLICPLWFIVVVGALLAACIFWLVSRAIHRKKA